MLQVTFNKPSDHNLSYGRGIPLAYNNKHLNYIK